MDHQADIAQARAYYQALSDQERNPFAAEQDAGALILNIRAFLALAGADASALDPTGKATAAEMETQLAEKTRVAYGLDARAFYASITTGRTSPISMHEQIQSALTHAGIDEAALDPDLKKSAETMRAEWKALEDHPPRDPEHDAHPGVAFSGGNDDDLLQNAIRMYQEMQSNPNPSTFDDHMLYIRSALFLNNHEDDASVLDPTGKQSATEVELKLAALTRDNALSHARAGVYQDLPDIHSKQEVEERVASIGGYLAAAGKDFAALDPTGKATSAEMLVQLTATVTAARLARGKAAWADLQDERRAVDVEAKLWRILAPGVTLADLMPELPDNKARRQKLDAVGKAAYLRHAEQTISDVAAGYLDKQGRFYVPADAARVDIHDDLGKAGESPTAFDGVLKIAAKQGAIARARIDLPHIGQEDYDPESRLADIKKDLAGVGATLRDLDPDKNEARIKSTIATTMKAAHIARAQHYFALFIQGATEGSLDFVAKFGFSNKSQLPQELQLIRSELKKAGVDSSALDPEGKSSTAQIEQQIAKTCQEYHLNPTGKPASHRR